MNRPSPVYDVQNESIYRSEMDRRDMDNVKISRASPYFLMTDETDGSVWRVSVVGGALTAVAV